MIRVESDDSIDGGYLPVVFEHQAEDDLSSVASLEGQSIEGQHLQSGSESDHVNDESDGPYLNQGLESNSLADVPLQPLQFSLNYKMVSHCHCKKLTM